MIQRAAQRRLKPNPALARHAHERAQSVQNRLADRITAFAGSMGVRLSRQILDLTKAIHSMAAQIKPAAADWQRASAPSIANPRKETR